MTYVIASPCIDVKDGACVDVCPVDCIYTGGRMLYIQPDECIDCGVCLSVCPVAAIFEDHALPPEEAHFAAINAEFFGPAVTGWGAPGGASPRFSAALDHPVVASYPHTSPASRERSPRESAADKGPCAVAPPSPGALRRPPPLRGRGDR